MRYSIALVSTLAAVALAKPQFLNTDFNVEEGEPFTLKFSGCDAGCTIVLQNGPKDDLQDVKTLTDDATSGSFDVTLDGLSTDTYNFKIIDNTTGDENYSAPFDIEGTAAPTTTSAEETTTTTEAETSTTEAETTTTEAETTTTSEASTSTEASSTKTSVTTVTSLTTTGSVTTPASTTTESEESTTSSAPAVTTTIPGDGAGQLNSPLGLVAGAVAAAFYLL